MKRNLYEILCVDLNASLLEIKKSYRDLVKRHHPDAGGKDETIIAINAAWEILGDPQKRRDYDQNQNLNEKFINESKQRGVRNAQASESANATQGRTSAAEKEMIQWVSNVYNPIDKLLGEIINPFQKQLRSLSADPYDDNLMEIFCSYLEQSQKRLKKIDIIYQSIPIPRFAQELGLNLYQCLSQVQDALNELELYTMGYVDSYLNDGREMIREAKQKRISMHAERNRFKIK